MDIRGNKVTFTPTEARWAQDASMRFKSMPVLAQKILDSRKEFAGPWLEAHEEVPPVSVALQDIIARLALNDFSNTLHDIALRHATENAQEQDVISVDMTQDEKKHLLHLARVDNEIAREQLEIPELIEIEDRIIIDDFVMFAATSDDIEPDQAVHLADMVNDPEHVAQHKAYQDEEAMQNLQATTPIIAALEADVR